MTLLSPALLEKLGRVRLVARRADASIGVGERRSRSKGAGLEFAEHRPYQPGDDVRHLDHHLHGRHGNYYIKEFHRYQQLPVTILLDGSASMDYGEPSKFGFAASVAGALGFLGLSGGDQVQVAISGRRRLRWSPRFHGMQCATQLMDWLGAQRARGATKLATVLAESAKTLPAGALLIVISDWMTDDLEDGLNRLRPQRYELVAIQVLAPEELEPERLGDGDVRFVDVETAREVELGLDSDSRLRYMEELAAWRRTAREYVLRHDGRWLQARSDDSLERLLLREWRASGLLT